MKNIQIDISKKYDLELHKINEEPLMELDAIQNFTIRRDLLGIDEISFTVYKYIQKTNGETVENPIFQTIKSNQLMLLNKMQYFIISKPETIGDGEFEYKQIKGYSREYELRDKGIFNYDREVRKIYDRAGEIDEDGFDIGFLNYLEKQTNWKVKYVNADLDFKYRHLSFSKSNFLQTIQELQKIFGCMIKFDTINRRIDVLKVDQLGDNKGVYLSNENYINLLREIVDDSNIVTRLYLYGKDNISIQGINITGQPYIEDYSYFMNEDYMTKELIQKLKDYDELIKSKEGIFKDLLIRLEKEEDILSTKKIELRKLENELKVVRNNIDIAINEENDADLNKYNKQQADLNRKIKAKNEEINKVYAKIDGINKEIKEFRQSIEIHNFLTVEEIRNMRDFIKEDYYTETSFIEENIEDLYKEGVDMLSISSTPRVSFSIDVEDFLSLVDAREYHTKLILGDIINIEHKGLDFYHEVRLIGMTHNPESNTLELKFSNKDDPYDANILEEILTEAQSNAGTIDVNKYKWDKAEDAEGMIIDYINSALDLAKQDVVKAEGQLPMIDERGIWLVKTNPDGTVAPEQIRMVNNVIAITKDNWNTVSTAISPEGVHAEVLAGKLILGANLEIASKSGIVSIKDELITIKDRNGRTRTMLGNYANGKYGLKIMSADGGSVVLDEDGMLQMWQEGRTDNVDRWNPLELYVYLPETTRNIYGATLRVQPMEFRAYSDSTETGGSDVVTSEYEGRQYDSTKGGGSEVVTSYTEDGKILTIENAYFRSMTTHRPIHVEQDYVETRPGGSDGHVHEFMKTLYHEHEFEIEPHTHPVDISGHTHRLRTPDHKHEFVVDGHDHRVTLPSHKHEIEPVIAKLGRVPRWRVRVNTNYLTSTWQTGANSNLDIAKYLIKGRWNKIEIESSDIGRIDATAFVQCLMNFDGLN